MRKNTINRWEEFNLIVESTELVGKEKIILLILFRYVNKDTGYASPSRERIKKLASITDNRTLDSAINSLINKGFLYRERVAGKRSRYYILVGTKIVPTGKSNDSGKYEVYGSVNFVEKGGVKFESQKEEVKEKIKYINLKDIVDDVISNVNLTKEEYNNLVKKYGQKLSHNKIVMFDDWIAEHEIDTKQHYRTINKWCRNEIDKNCNNIKKENSLYEEFDFEEV